MSSKRITLKWLNLIKARLSEEKYKSNSELLSFIKPILDYGNREEIRITKEFKELNLKFDDNTEVE